jgi:hypothetical protein
MNDPRNERWAALLPKEEPPVQQTGLGTLTEAFKTFGDIRRDLKDEMAPAVGTVATAQADPMASSLKMVETIMAMKADNPMVEIMKLQLQSVNDQAEKARDREAALQKELRDIMLKMTERQQPQQNGGLKGILAELKEFMPAIKELIPAAAETVRATHSNGWDILRDVAPTVASGLFGLINVIASRWPVAPAPANGTAPQAQIAAPAQANGQPPQQQQAQTPPQNLPRFVQFLAQPSNFEAFKRYFTGFKEGRNTGADFAEWIFDGNGEEPVKEARGMGTLNIMALLKGSQAWFIFQADEAKLAEFIDQALAWQAPEPDGDEDEDELVDLTEGAHA